MLHWTYRILAVFAVFIMTTPQSLWAGGGPENVLLVVNDRSWASKTIANHYADIRKIPTSNILYISWTGSVERTTVTSFRDKILTPILKAIEERKLANQIDCVVYSSDFPYEISFGSELAQKGKFNSGSITGLTYLHDMVMAKQYGRLGGRTNWYAQTSTERSSTRSFSALTQWLADGRATTKGGRRYLLSTMLGYSSGRGNSIEEIVDYLQDSAKADGTFPNGTVYFMTNKDVRTTTRSPNFRSTVAALKLEGAKAEIVEGTTPTKKSDVIGLTMGKASYRWNKSGSTFLPGAISDNLTSFGGILKSSASQTPLTESLRFGAAASSGTVIEPYAIQAKFPHPTIHLHYRRGCSLAEAFYLSVTAPYQLLIVGDPLCQPFAQIPTVRVAGITNNKPISGIAKVQPSVASLGLSPVKHYQVFIDGRLRHTLGPNEAFEFDTATMPDGYHELRVVATMSGAVQTQGRTIIPFTVNNRDHSISASVTSRRQLNWDGKMAVKVSTPDAKHLVIFHKRQKVIDAPGPSKIMAVSPRSLGMGPTELIIAGLAESNLDNVFARPVAIEIGPGRTLRARATPIGIAENPGLALTLKNGQKKPIKSTTKNWLKAAGVKKGEAFKLEAMLTVPKTGLYQFQAMMNGDLVIRVDNSTVLSLSGRPNYQRYELPIHMEKGTHLFTAQAATGKRHSLELAFGNKGTHPLAGPMFRHGLPTKK